LFSSFVFCFVLFRVFHRNATLTPPNESKPQPPERNARRHDARTIHRIAPLAFAEHGCAGFPRDIEATCSL
jgi:hypothetical protein